MFQAKYCLAPFFPKRCVSFWFELLHRNAVELCCKLTLNEHNSSTQLLGRASSENWIISDHMEHMMRKHQKFELRKSPGRVLQPSNRACLYYRLCSSPPESHSPVKLFHSRTPIDIGYRPLCFYSKFISKFIFPFSFRAKIRVHVPISA